jgi:hypothetical protein
MSVVEEVVEGLDRLPALSEVQDDLAKCEGVLSAYVGQWGKPSDAFRPVWDRIDRARVACELAHGLVKEITDWVKGVEG